MTSTHTRPTEVDEVAAAGSELIGGPVGSRATEAPHWWTPVRVTALVMLGMFALGMVQKLPCWNGGWFSGQNSQYVHACYSDIPHLFQGRGFAEGLTPYLDRIPDSLSGGMSYLEYPVLTGLFMKVAAWFTPGGGIEYREQMYWMVNAGMLMACAAVVAACAVHTHRHRPWDALLVALAPAFALTATINWDLLAVALTAAGLLLWSRSRPLLAGVLIGLATAAKLYPVLLLGPLLVLCLRAGRLPAFTRALGGAVAAWGCVNVPVLIAAPQGWATFYTFSQERPVDFGSFWLLLSQRSGADLNDAANTLGTLLMVVGCLAIAALALYAPRRPRLAQLAFLVVALFIVTNKVYSPQYVLWLIPLAALARPRWRDFLIWQTCEVAYFLGIWMYLAYTGSGDKHQGLPAEGYQLVVLIHLFGTLYLCALLVRDALFPERDPVRQDGSDDPGGGPLDRAPDRFVLGRGQPRPQHRAATEPHPSDPDGPDAGTVHWGSGTDRGPQ